MRIAYLYHANGSLSVINIEAVSIIEGIGQTTRITFINGEHEPFYFNYDIDEFCMKVFSPDDTELTYDGEVESVDIYENESGDEDL